MILPVIALALAFLQDAPPAVAPPRVAWPNQGDFRNEALDATVVIRVETLSKRLVLRWCHDGEIHDEGFDLPFWPTAATNAGDAQLVVAGKRPSNGNTIVQRWDLSWTQRPDDAHRTAVRETTVYDRKTEGRRDPRCLQELLGAPHRVLIVFGDSGDLCAMDTVSGEVSLVYAASRVPTLSLEWMDDLWAAEHPTEGFTYVLQCNHDLCKEGGVLFHDTDEDGRIDSFEEVSLAEWPVKVARVPWVRRF